MMRIVAFAALLLTSTLATASVSVAQPPTPATCNVVQIASPAAGTWKRIEVTWSDVAGETGYRVFRNGTLAGEVGANVTLFEDHSYPVPNDYLYCVEAFDGGGSSGQCCSNVGPLDATTVESVDWFHDAFPEDESAGLPGTPAYDVATALIKTGRNLAPLTGNLNRYVVHGDTLVVTADADSVHLMFRIRPGVGNYNTVGDPTSGLPITAFDFWGSYGTFPGSVSGTVIGVADFGAAIGAHQAAQSKWDPLVWNSARIDTAEINLFPVQALGNIEQLTSGKWRSTYHEHDFAARALIMTPKNRCFLINPAGPVSPANTTCTGIPGWVNAATGWDGQPTTLEGVKVLPDNLLTPGAHVQYYLRISKSGVVSNIPEYTQVLQESGERSVDGHRWQHFAILPDRWRDPAFGGLGMATMLYLDYADRRGNERIWKGLADSTGATALADIGNADGYGGVPGDDTDINSATYHIDNKNAAPGTTWEMYGIRGAESKLAGQAGSLGARLAFAPRSHIAPYLDVLNTYYKMILLLSGDLQDGILGPFNDRSQDDIMTLKSWLGSGSTVLPHDRGLFIEGEGFVESAQATLVQQLFVSEFLGANLRDPDYRSLSGNSASGQNLSTIAPHTPGLYPIQNTSDGDVLELELTTVGASEVCYWQNVGVNGPYVASVHKAHTAAMPFVSLMDGWDLARLGVDKGFACLGCVKVGPAGTAASNQISARARLSYFYETLTNLFGSIAAIVGAPSNTVDVPQVRDIGSMLEFTGIRNNPLRSGTSTLELQLAGADDVRADLYDVRGRHVRQLLNRRMAAGHHSLVWDGRNDNGDRVPRGVYFARIRSHSTGEGRSRQLVVLR